MMCLHSLHSSPPLPNLNNKKSCRCNDHPHRFKLLHEPIQSLGQTQALDKSLSVIPSIAHLLSWSSFDWNWPACLLSMDERPCFQTTWRGCQVKVEVAICWRAEDVTVIGIIVAFVATADQFACWPTCVLCVIYVMSASWRRRAILSVSRHAPHRHRHHHAAKHLQIIDFLLIHHMESDHPLWSMNSCNCCKSASRL